MSVFGARGSRRLLTWLLIVQQVVAGAGIALPCPAAAAGSTERFPCEHCGCGCRSAEECWAHCCCFTNQQKVEWGRQNGVAVPEFVVAAAKRETTAAERPKCAHCHHRAAPQSSASPSSTCTENGDEPGTDKNHSSGGISVLSALHCHGLTQQWQAVRASWPGDRHGELFLVLLPRGRVEPLPLLKHLFSPSAPPTPPPKLG
jgi:hypothetical protein